jgi:hypothetical protein
MFLTEKMFPLSHGAKQGVGQNQVFIDEEMKWMTGAQTWGCFHMLYPSTTRTLSILLYVPIYH